MKVRLTVLALIAMTIGAWENAEGCSRVLYVGDTTVANPDSVLRIVGRSLDWSTPIPTNVYVYPRGMEKMGNDTPGAITWKSKYGAVYAVSYDSGVTEGMNEKGLVINGLFCKGTVYNNPQTMNRPGMSLAVFVAWLLDNNATTPEVVKVLKEHDFTLTGATFDGGTVSALHWGITDAQGRSAVLEFDNGKVNVYEGQDMVMLTNDPTFPSMQAINNYWKKIGGTHMLPGTVVSADRFVRGSFFDSAVEHTNSEPLGQTIVQSIMYNVSVPFHYNGSGDKELNNTQWRSYSNIRDRLYWFDLLGNRGVFYIDLKKCDLRPGAPVLKLTTSKYPDLAGDATKYLEKVPPFKPMY